MQASAVRTIKSSREERQISVRLDDSEYRQLKGLAEADGMKPGTWARAKVRAALKVSTERREMMLTIMFAAELIGEFLRAAQDKTEGRPMSDEGLRREMEFRAAERAFGTLDRAKTWIKKLSGESVGA